MKIEVEVSDGTIQYAIHGGYIRYWGSRRRVGDQVEVIEASADVPVLLTDERVLKGLQLMAQKHREHSALRHLA